jgi:hypothetical protein
MISSVDVRVVDWGITGHELPFITSVVRSFRMEDMYVVISLPNHIVSDDGYRMLVDRFSQDSGVVFDPFTLRTGPRRPRRLQKFLSSCLTNLSIERSSPYRCKVGRFYTTINSYFHPKFGSTQSLLGRVWAGHVLHPTIHHNAVSVETFNSLGVLRTCRGLGLTDERIVDNSNVRCRSNGLYFNFPEFVNIDVSVNRKRPARPVCLLIGALSSYKNVLQFLEVANNVRSIDFYLVGRLSIDQYSDDELRQIEHLCTLSNVYRIDKYLTDGKEFNDYIQMADVVWLSYRNFEHSSNVQIKANVLGKTCIVGNSGLIYHRCKEYDFVSDETELISAYLSAGLHSEWNDSKSDSNESMQLKFLDSLRQTKFL